MQTETIPLEETDCFSTSFINYIQEKEELRAFYNEYPSSSNFKKVIEQRNFSASQRQTLADELKSQYQGVGISSHVQENIEKLRAENTFTITTGHQLNIFTGPLYFVYKIVTVINTCKALKKSYPEYKFVPVYWMASEDHDFEEIAHFRLDGKKLIWETEQSGAVGRMDPSALLEMAKALPKGAEFFEEAYAQPTLANAVRSYVNHLFGEEGIVVLDADSPELKKALIPVIEDDLFTHTTEKLVTKTSSDLENAGCKAQVNARQVNFFYLKDSTRERIERIEEGFEVVDTNLRFSDAEMKKLIVEHPEQFSPNVLLRPLYQEMILPNLSYVGGPSELVYWLQFKSVFDHFNVPFPILQPRNFGLIIPKATETKWAKTGLETKEMFSKVDSAFTHWVEANSTNGLSFSEDLDSLKALESELKKKAEKVDPTLVQHIEALHATFSKRIEKAEKKLMRSEKRNHQEKKQQIESVKEVLFPGGTLQERKDNFLNFYLKDPKFIKRLLDTFDPFEFKMILLYE